MSYPAQLYFIVWKNVYVGYIRRHLVFTLLQVTLALALVYNVRIDMLTEVANRRATAKTAEYQKSRPKVIPAQSFPLQHPLENWYSGPASLVTTLYYVPSEEEFHRELVHRAAVLLNISKVPVTVAVGEGKAALCLIEYRLRMHPTSENVL